MSGTDCTDVCEIVIERLLRLGFKIDTTDKTENHDDIIEALSQVEFVKEK